MIYNNLMTKFFDHVWVYEYITSIFYKHFDWKISFISRKHFLNVRSQEHECENEQQARTRFEIGFHLKINQLIFQ